jgi:broad specificity phosphatase PhoE
MPTFLLIRHATTDMVGHTLSGRLPGVHLNEAGRLQAEQLTERLARHGIQRLFSSPLERARETAEPLANKLGLKIQVSEALTDLDFGDWTNRAIAELQPLPKWQQWNLFRAGVRIPNGELMSEVQGRMVNEMERLSRCFPEDCLALVSHNDPIRAALVHYLGMPLDLMQRLEINPASVSILEVSDWGAQLRCANLT